MKQETREFTYTVERKYKRDKQSGEEVPEIEYRCSGGTRSFNPQEAYQNNRFENGLVARILEDQERALEENPDVLLYQVKIVKRLSPSDLLEFSESNEPTEPVEPTEDASAE